MLRGRLLFANGFMLEFMEYLHEGKMDRKGEMIFRCDNAPHHSIATFPYHKHLPFAITESEERGILDVLSEVEVLISEGRASPKMSGEPSGLAVLPSLLRLLWPSWKDH